MTVDGALNTLRNHWCFTSLEYVEAMQIVDGHVAFQAAQIEALKAALGKANSQAEHFEREWYLRGDEIEALTKDAARYRALRHAQSWEPHSSHTQMPVVFTARDWTACYTPEGLDKAMDYVIEDMAAIKAKESGQTTALRGLDGIMGTEGTSLDWE